VLGVQHLEAWPTFQSKISRPFCPPKQQVQWNSLLSLKPYFLDLVTPHSQLQFGRAKFQKNYCPHFLHWHRENLGILSVSFITRRMRALFQDIATQQRLLFAWRSVF
jgi:hypothetical protein